MRKTRLYALALAAALVLSLSGCAGVGSVSGSAGSGDRSPAQSAQPGGSQSEGPQEGQGFPLTLTDAAGREVTIENEPQRLVSGYYITTSMLIALGQADKLVGVEAKANTRPIYAEAAPALLELPSVGSAKEFDLEGCAALEPDLVILPLKLRDSAETLARLGIPTLTVNPESLEELNHTISLLGQATGAGERARALLDYNRETVDFLEQTLEGAERPTVYLAGNSSYLRTAGANMYQNTLIELGGGTNVAAELPDPYWTEISYEQLLAWDPEVIVVASGADYGWMDLRDDPQLAELTAVKNESIYVLPSDYEAWDSPVPSAMVGSRWMASLLHGDRYPTGDYQADMAQFYGDFYGIQVPVY